MRHFLFVDIGGVGNDPNWHRRWDERPAPRLLERRFIWRAECLSANPQDLLERLVPKLKIASQCSFSDKFLVVQGRRHAYKIRLGSGNILIAPQDKYLCIVPTQAQVDKAGDKVFPPFEGDRVLSVTLSKAFLLAADDKITDAIILQQL